MWVYIIFMKTKILIILSILIFQLSHSQNEWLMGIETGPSRATLRGNLSPDNFEPQITMYVSPVIEYKFSSHFSLKSGIGYDTKVSKAVIRGGLNIGNEDDIFDNDMELKSQLTYLTMPLLIKYRGKGKVQPFFNTGLFLSYNIKSTEYRVTDFDYGLVAGGGVNINILKNNFSIEVRNNYGLKNISGYDSNQDYDLKTNTTFILLGYSFMI